MSARRAGRLITDIVIAFLVFYAWIGMVIRGGGVLSSSGIGSLKYFTVLSNLLEGFASVAAAVSLLRSKELSLRLESLKWVAGTAVMVTFSVVMLFLGHIYGYPAMLRGGSLHMHLIVPLLSLAEMLFLREKELPERTPRYAAAVVLAYGVFYFIRVLLGGKGPEGWYVNDFYAFTLWGIPVGIGLFALLLIGTYFMSLGLMRLGDRLLMKGKKPRTGGCA